LRKRDFLPVDAFAAAIVAALMATVTPPRPAPSIPPELPALGRRALRHRDLLAGAVTSVAVAVAMFVLYEPSHVNYDAQWALLWARDAWEGFTPEYRADFAPTPHPLATLLSSLALPFGAGAPIAVIWSSLLGFGAVVYLTYRLGAELFAPAVGLIAAVVVLTRPAIERDALIGYQDLPFAALVASALLLEVRRPRRGAPVLILLALAGLLRPEAWVLAGLYWVWLWPATDRRARITNGLLVAAAPLIWAATDWLVTGDPLHSLHGTAALAEEADRRRDVEDVPYWTVRYFGFVLREPLLLGVPVGLAFAWTYARKRSLLPLAVMGAMVAVFALGPLFGLPLIRRYLDTPAVFLSLFYGLAVAGWTLLPRGRQRRAWQVIGALMLGLSLAFIPWHAAELKLVDKRVRKDGLMYRDLKRLAHKPQIRAVFERCAPLTTGDHRPIPFLRYWLGGAPGSVGTVAGGQSEMGRLLLIPRKNWTTRRVYNRKAGTVPFVKPPDGYRRIFRNRSWRVYAAPGCLPS
jgi:hypothetical protein